MMKFSKIGLILVPLLASCSQGDINSALSVKVKNSADGGSGDQIFEVSLPLHHEMERSKVILIVIFSYQNYITSIFDFVVRNQGQLLKKLKINLICTCKIFYRFFHCCHTLFLCGLHHTYHLLNFIFSN